MAKKLLLLFTLVSVMACTQRDTAEQGVVINGVRWATRNVDTPGTFTANPQDLGGHFNWSQAQNACPEGWRMPTVAELQSLTSATNAWTTQEGTNGRLIGTEPHQIFFPASGARFEDGLSDIGARGIYWGNYRTTEIIGMTDITTVAYLEFDNRRLVAEMEWADNDMLAVISLSLRCVAITDADRAQAEREREAEAKITSLDGVVINGIRWATRNVDMPGTFAENPESFGMFYQWDRNIGWSSTNPMTNSDGNDIWHDSQSRNTTWERENDPCPQGWRVPTRAELNSLLNSGNTLTARNGVNGRLFGVAPHQIFLPFAGSSCEPYFIGAPFGAYWSANIAGEEAWFLGLDDIGADMDSDWRGSVFSVRCVAQ